MSTHEKMKRIRELMREEEGGKHRAVESYGDKEWGGGGGMNSKPSNVMFHSDEKSERRGEGGK